MSEKPSEQSPELSSEQSAAEFRQAGIAATEAADRLSDLNRRIETARQQEAELSADLSIAMLQLSVIRNEIESLSNSFPVISVQDVARNATAVDLKISNYPGLRFLQVFQTEAGGKLISVWEGAEALEAHGDKLAGDFGVAPADRERELHGPQRLAAVANLPLKDRIRNHAATYIGYALAVIASVAGVLSHFDSILDLTTQYFWAPQVTAVGGTATLPVLAGQRFSTEFELQNESSFASSHIQIKSAQVFDQKGNAADKLVVLDEFRPKTFPLVNPAESKTFAVPGRAIRPGLYKLQVKGKFRPLFRSVETEFSQSREIEVWEPFTIAFTKAEAYRKQAACLVHFRIRSGQSFPAGVGMRAELGKVANVEFAGVKFPGVYDHPDPTAITTPGQEAAGQSWQSARLESFDTQMGSVILKTSDGAMLTDLEWQAIADKVQFFWHTDLKEQPK